MKKICVFTSGGDSPGMNAGIRAVVRYGRAKGLEVIGVFRGYDGLINGKLKDFNERSVSNIIQQGGTILKTARCAEFRTEQGVKKAAETLTKNNIEAVIAIGGDGTFKGLLALKKYWQGQIIGVPGTIDNDLYGTDYTIGFDTAVNTALEAIDKIRDTANAHERCFIVEVMGRHAGFLAIAAGIAGGVEEILVPETKTDIKAIAQRLKENEEKGKQSNIIIVAEGDDAGNAFEISEKLKKVNDIDYKISILGYIQRGGAPTANDRILASKLGAYAVDLYLAGESGVMAGETKGELCAVSLEDAVNKKKDIDKNLLNIGCFLSQ